MDLFTKKFFRLAFGFVLIILISVAIIVFTNTMLGDRGTKELCVINCVE